MRFDPDSIRKLRRKLGLTKAEFGRKIKMSRQYVHQLETGSRRPNVRTLERIIEAYRVRPEIFFVD